MDCRTTAIHLSALLDGECPTELSDGIIAHVAGCSACAERRHRLGVARLALAHLFDADQDQSPPLPKNFVGMAASVPTVTNRVP